MARTHAGPIPLAGGGRTDVVPMDVAPGSYVFPADIVSALGEGNTLNGYQVIDKWIAQQPVEEGYAKGGAVGEPIPIIAAGGEYVLTPDQVAAIGQGDMDAGHEILDAVVKQIRADHIKTLKKLPGPVRD